MDWLKTRGE